MKGVEKKKKTAQEYHFKLILDDNENASAKFFNYVRHHRDKQDTPPVRWNNADIVDDEEKANVFINYFYSVYKQN